MRMTKISVAEARKAAEMMLIVSGYLILPVVEWDDKPVGMVSFHFFDNVVCSVWHKTDLDQKLCMFSEEFVFFVQESQVLWHWHYMES